MLGIICCTPTDSATAAETVTAEPTSLSERTEKETTLGSESASAKPAVTFTFQLPDGSVKDCVFRARPIGVDFLRGVVPLKVTRIKDNTQAEVLGIQKDWLLMKMDGVDLPRSFEANVKVITEAVSILPKGQ
eukprot:TRINITY_DN8328_c0_g1_i1.p2 TRINITY_DN8328_c0_g1~~TRINITY_DN8328_c0_g1_i1.p2  ORF type:complete len:132 (+),score=18.65 TRINITY_DN8328_c0_g1_i1:60-455(+)